MPAERPKINFTRVKQELHGERHGLIVYRDPILRRGHLRETLEGDGIPVDTIENPHGAYCALGLTNVPDDFKPKLRVWQSELLDILKEAGIEGHDPITAPEAPDIDPTIPPGNVYRIDEARVARHRIFTFLNIFPSTGAGAEAEIAKRYNRIAVVLHHENIRVSTMQSDRSIHLQFSDLEKQRDRFVQLFEFLQKFEPGQGFDSEGNPILLGFRNGRSYNLEELVYAFFPDLKYNFDPKVDILKYQVLNPEIFT
ncbi:MAG: hypothetical protein WCT22_01065 [Patescibacteria group bacterium]